MTKQVIRSIVPIPGAREISLMKMDNRYHLHALTGDAVYFVFDTLSWTVLYHESLARFGRIVREGLAWTDDGQLVILMSATLLIIDPVFYRISQTIGLSRPATSGIACKGNRVYYGSGSLLCETTLTNK
ncbi:hypothetical protein [Marinicrinis lubricantis]|uniref:Uncharacterized protein n=1 Tax=Marinicrinis lubricantis TaxID=2086470 RepID=A0ABW1IM17_9BACL